MLTMHTPTLLALLGTVLMAIVIFAPAHAQATVTTSFAPMPSPPVERRPSAAETFSARYAGEDELFDGVGAPVAETRHAPVTAVAWPSLVDPSAAGCDTVSRLALVAALAAVRGPWAETILDRARDEETDALVREALANVFVPYG